jgi:hypothetical protein
MSATADAPQTLTIVEDGREVTVAADAAEGRLRITARTAREALGWRLPGDVELDGLDAALGRPVAADHAERAVYVGVAAAARARRLASLEAPDVTLPDLDGREHTLAAQRGRKVLLVAYASW